MNFKYAFNYIKHRNSEFINRLVIPGNLNVSKVGLDSISMLTARRMEFRRTVINTLIHFKQILLSTEYLEMLEDGNCKCRQQVCQEE